MSAWVVSLLIAGCGTAVPARTDSGSTPDTPTVESGPSMDTSTVDVVDSALDAPTLDAPTLGDSAGERADVPGHREASVDGGSCERSSEGEAPVGGACRPTRFLCGGLCVDQATDDGNCGACGRACVAGQFCAAGACVCLCGAGLACCADSCSRSRACADLNNDRAHCGACFAPCGADQRCVRGVCSAM